MNDRRGGRSRVTKESLRGAPLPDAGGSPSGDEGHDSFEDDSGQDSSHHDDSDSRNGNNGNNANGNNNRRSSTRSEHEEHPDHGSDGAQDDAGSESPHGLDLSPEETERWNQITGENRSLKKANDHGTRKITELGQENTRYREENESLKSDVESLKRGFGQLLARLQTNGNNDRGNGRRPSADTDYDDFDYDGADNQDDRTNSRSNADDDVWSEIDGMKQVVARIFHDQQEHHTTQAHSEEVDRVSTGLGVDPDVADKLIDLRENGDILELAEALDYATLPAEARRTKREARDRQRSSVGHPTTTGFAQDSDSADTDAIASQAAKLAKMPDSPRKRQAIDTFLENNPVAFDALAAELGFNF